MRLRCRIIMGLILVFLSPMDAGASDHIRELEAAYWEAQFSGSAQAVQEFWAPEGVVWLAGDSQPRLPADMEGSHRDILANLGVSIKQYRYEIKDVQSIGDIISVAFSFAWSGTTGSQELLVAGWGVHTWRDTPDGPRLISEVIIDRDIMDRKRLDPSAVCARPWMYGGVSSPSR